MPRYRALYVERRAADYPLTRQLLERHRDAPLVWLDSYSELFFRRHQDFQSQKSAPALIAAVAEGPYLHEAPTRVCGIHDLPVYYNDQLRNCVYNCDYCFLQGMHPSGHTLVAVNSDDFHDAAAMQAREGPYWLSISYLTDILGFQPVLPLVSEWFEFARTHPDVTVEVRTKGEAPDILRAEPLANVVLIWSVSPAGIASRYERGCASFPNRLLAAKGAAERGWRVRLAVDPVVLVPGWKDAYASMVAELAEHLGSSLIEAATYGVFRIGSDYMRRVTAARADSPLLHHPFTGDGRVVSYSDTEVNAVHETVGEPLRRWLDDAVTFVHG